MGKKTYDIPYHRWVIFATLKRVIEVDGNSILIEECAQQRGK